MADDILPYGRQWIEDDDVEAVVEALRGVYLTTGPTVARFEEALAEAVGAAHAVAVCNGTAALHAACAAAGLGPGDEVLVPAMTFLASANCARYVGAEPVFVDVDPDSGLIDLDDAARRITDRSKAIIPVHLTGRPVDLDALAALAEAHDLRVIEDAAHALGARHHDRPIGGCTRSSMAIFSFHPVKHVTTGEGGAITTNDPALAEAMRVFRSHGMVREQLRQPSPGPWYYEQQTLGFNYRITDLQCALGLSQLAKLPRFLARRRALAARYDALLAQLEHVRPVAVGTPDTLSAYHLYAILIDFAAVGRDRAAVMAGLRERGVLTQVHYIPVPAQPYYQDRGADMREYPGAQAYYERTLSVPLYPAMADADVDRVVAALREVLTPA
jgi:perosamine synthetase